MLSTIAGEQAGLRGNIGAYPREIDSVQHLPRGMMVREREGSPLQSYRRACARAERPLVLTWQYTENENVSFGTELREHRERQGVDLSVIAERTKVSERYLRALEENAYGELPGGIFNKGIVRGYCQQLGLDEDEWLGRFAASFEEPAGEPDWNTFAENVKRNREIAGASRRRWWGVVLMVLALVALGWVAWHYVLKPRMAVPKTDLPDVGMASPST